MNGRPSIEVQPSRKSLDACDARCSISTAGYSSKSQIQLEKKDDMKRRGLASPDLRDTLAMTFAVRPSTRRFQQR